MLTYPVYYHDKNQEDWLTLNPCCYGKYAKRHKIFQSHFLKMATVTLSNFKWPQLQYFLDDSLHLNTKIISRIYIFENYISQNTKKIVGTVSCEWVTNGVRHQASHSREQRIATYLLVGTLMAQSPKTSQGGISLSSKVRPPSLKTVLPIRSQPPAWQCRWKQSPMPSAGLFQVVTDGPYMLLSSQIQWACYKMWKVEWEAQTSIYVSAGHPPVDAKPRTSHHWLPAQERGLERESAQQRKCSTIFLERMRMGNHQADEHWNCFKGNIGKTAERRDGVNNYGLLWVHGYHLVWNWADISSTKRFISY